MLQSLDEGRRRGIRSNGYDYRYENQRRLCAAVMGCGRGGHEAVVKLLLEGGAAIEVKVRYCIGGHEAIVKLLLKGGVC